MSILLGQEVIFTKSKKNSFLNKNPIFSKGTFGLLREDFFFVNFKDSKNLWTSEVMIFV